MRTLPRPRILFTSALTLLMALSVPALLRADEITQSRAEIDALAQEVPGFKPVSLSGEPGEVKLTLEQSLTVDDLRGVHLDPGPPELGDPGTPHPEKMTDSYPPGEAPYVAEGILPFSFRHFTNELSYGGWHNWGMQDYASAHGFGVIYPYNHTPADHTHLPEGTKWLRWGGFVDWHEWMPAHGLPDGRYDKLVEVDVAKILDEEKTFELQPGYDQLMIDMEHGLLGPEKLRGQDWYPKDAARAEQAAFEKRYYDGYAKTYTEPVDAARRAGWRDISLYGWEPFPRSWFGLEKVRIDPATDWAWNAFGKQIYQSVDILNPSVYCFYTSPQNVAYTLANIDLNMQLVNSMEQRKPMRPYYWTLLHGGGGGWRWWQNQPIASEDVRAMTAMCFFTGCDGLVLWNWSGTGNHHRPGPLKEDADVMVGREFSLRPDGAMQDAEPTAFARYDVLHVKQVMEDGVVRFHKIDPADTRGEYGTADDDPIYSMAKSELEPLLRPSSEPVAAMVEGLALARALEYTLRNGEVKIDVPAQEQYAGTLPIVRRVKLGATHVLITYDPLWASRDQAREIRLTDFDGREGRTLVLPADEQARVFVVIDDQAAGR